MPRVYPRWRIGTDPVDTPAVHRPLRYFLNAGRSRAWGDDCADGERELPHDSAQACRGIFRVLEQSWRGPWARKCLSPILCSWGEDSFHDTRAVFLVASGFAVLGSAFAWIVLQDPDKNLDNGDQDWKEYLAASGHEDIDWGDENEPNAITTTEKVAD